MTPDSDNASADAQRRLTAWYRGLEQSGDQAAVERAITAIHTRRLSRAKFPVSASLRAAAALAVFVAGGAADRALLRREAAKSDPYSVVFVFRAPAARQVSLIGDFNGWKGDATHLVRRGDGTWSATLHLAPGIHAYAYVIDGETWAIDPLAPRSSANDFGSPTSTLVVSPGQGT